MIDKDIEQALKKRYKDLHPLIFQRSVEKAKTNSELFDILDTVPNQYPIFWNEKERRWEFTLDLLQNERSF